MCPYRCIVSVRRTSRAAKLDALLGPKKRLSTANRRRGVFILDGLSHRFAAIRRACSGNVQVIRNRFRSNRGTRRKNRFTFCQARRNGQIEYFRSARGISERSEICDARTPDRLTARARGARARVFGLVVVHHEPRVRVIVRAFIMLAIEPNTLSPRIKGCGNAFFRPIATKIPRHARMTSDGRIFPRSR